MPYPLLFLHHPLFCGRVVPRAARRVGGFHLLWILSASPLPTGDCSSSNFGLCSWSLLASTSASLSVGGLLGGWALERPNWNPICWTLRRSSLCSRGGLPIWLRRLSFFRIELYKLLSTSGLRLRELRTPLVWLSRTRWFLQTPWRRVLRILLSFCCGTQRSGGWRSPPTHRIALIVPSELAFGLAVGLTPIANWTLTIQPLLQLLIGWCGLPKDSTFPSGSLSRRWLRGSWLLSQRAELEVAAIWWASPPSWSCRPSALEQGSECQQDGNSHQESIEVCQPWRGWRLCFACLRGISKR